MLFFLPCPGPRAHHVTCKVPTLPGCTLTVTGRLRRWTFGLGRLKKNTGHPARHPALLFALERCGKAGDWLQHSIFESVSYIKKSLCTTCFLYFSSSFVPHELTWNLIFTPHLPSCVRNCKYKSLWLKSSIFLGECFILICYSFSMVLDGTSSNYIKRNVSYMQIFTIWLQCAQIKFQ